ncbi:hypothetical protein AJ79_00719 [Helicocarpus griseus UAMH5409]|uniref:Uncharacterized protein n=1 Tax=Helicocarpus griseus UAMH5409 TaxID=1447875 RepID=A0A2B7YAK6_9EURO|nr:hypothetical protein AJ79_00719 [Helicocarpus griseus UAMH5409]
MPVQSAPTPAPPILASTLLDSSLENGHGHAYAQRARTEDVSWDLTKDIAEGVSFTPEKSILCCGRVIGISGLQSASVKSRGEGTGEDIRSWVDEFSHHILINLLSKHPPGQSFPRAFVIQYFDTRPFSLSHLKLSLQERLPDHSAEDIDSILENVQTHRAYDFDELLQAVSQVSDILFGLQQRLDRQGQQEGKGKHSSHAPVILLIEGVDQSLEEIIRTSNSVAGHARLIPLLRTLTALSRTYASFLCTIIVNSISLPRIPSESLAQAYFSSGTEDEHDDRVPRPHQQQLQREQQQYRPALPIQSIFSILKRPDQRSKAQTFSPYFSQLARSLDQGCDVHFLVSKAQEKMIIEVAKDRVGDAVGRWCDL